MAFNSPVWFNVGSEAAPAVLGVLHQQRRGHHGVDPDPGQDRGDAVQVRQRHRHQPVADPQLARAASGRRHRVGPGQLHARVRRLRRRHQVGRQDPPRREDGDPEHRSPRRRGVHLVQGQGREEGLEADRRRLRRLVRRRGVQVRLLPELEQLGARHRRFHGGGAEGPRLVDARRARRPAGGDLQGARPLAADRGGGLAVRRSGAAVRHHHQRLAHLGEHGAHQRVQPVLRVHVPRRFGLQPGVAEPAQVSEARRWRIRHRFVQEGRRADHPGAGDHRRERHLPDQEDRGELAPLPAARPGVRESGRAAHVARAAVRLGGGARLRGGDHRDHDRLGVSNQRRDRARRDRARSTAIPKTKSRSCG